MLKSIYTSENYYRHLSTQSLNIRIARYIENNRLNCRFNCKTDTVVSALHFTLALHFAESKSIYFSKPIEGAAYRQRKKQQKKKGQR